MHAGHLGDVLNSLPVIKELSKTHNCNLYIQANKPLPADAKYWHTKDWFRLEPFVEVYSDKGKKHSPHHLVYLPYTKGMDKV